MRNCLKLDVLFVNLQNVHSALKLLTQVMGILKLQNKGAATDVLYMIPPHTKAIPLTPLRGPQARRGFSFIKKEPTDLQLVLFLFL